MSHVRNWVAGELAIGSRIRSLSRSFPPKEVGLLILVDNDFVMSCSVQALHLPFWSTKLRMLCPLAQGNSPIVTIQKRKGQEFGTPGVTHGEFGGL